MKPLIAVMTLSCVVMSSQAQQAVTFTSPPDAFRLNASATGTVSKSGPFLMVRLEQHAMWASKSYAETNNVIAYKVGVAANNQNGRWEPLRWSDEVKAPYTIKPGETKQIPVSTLLIPVDGLKTLNGTWLVLQMALKNGGDEGYTYAHSGPLKLQ
ncbi:MAG: hypothetical protein ACN6OP_12850 [Pseudomonadales bacterium]